MGGLFPGSLIPGSGSSRLLLLLIPSCDLHLGDQLPAGQGPLDHLADGLIQKLPVLEPELHLRRMDVDVDVFRLHRKVQHGKGIFMLHHIALVAILNGLGDEAAFYVPAIDEIIFKIPVAPGDGRLPDEPRHLEHLRFHGDRQKLRRDLPAVNGVNNILQVMVPRGMELILVIDDQTDGDLRMGQGDLFHQIRHMGSLRGRGL